MCFSPGACSCCLAPALLPDPTPTYSPTPPPTLMPCSDPGYYQDNAAQTSCKPCPAGTWVGASGSDSCDPAPPGAWTGPAASELNWCPSGTVSSTDNTGCIGCPPGYWRPGGDASPSSNACYRVPSGWRTLTSADASLITPCRAGEVSWWSFGSTTTWEAGQPMPTATRTPTDQSTCFVCTGATYAALTASSDCQQCRAGTQANVTGTPPRQTGCQLCPTLYYRDYYDNSTCHTCGPGYETGVLLGATDCTPCEPGYVNPSQTDSVSDVSPGTGAATYYNATPSSALPVSTSCLAW